MIESKFNRLKASANQWGWKRALFRIVLRYAARYLGFHIHVVRIRTLEPDPNYPSTPPDIDFRIIQSEELLQASEDLELDLDRNFVRDSIARGDIAFGAFDGPMLVAYIWSASSSSSSSSSSSAPHTDKLWVRVDRLYAYAYKSFVRPDYRGQRLGPAIYLFMNSKLCKQGRTHLVSFVSLTNFRNLAVGKHIGTSPIGHAGYIEIFGRSFSFRTRSVKKIGFEFYQPHMPAP